MNFMQTLVEKFEGHSFRREKAVFYIEGDFYDLDSIKNGTVYYRSQYDATRDPPSILSAHGLSINNVRFKRKISGLSVTFHCSWAGR